MDMENKNQLGVFDDVREAIQAAYDAQRVLMQDYTTEDRDRFIAKIKENFLKIIDEETTKEFVETGYGRLADKLRHAAPEDVPRIVEGYFGGSAAQDVQSVLYR